jgi:hypothetical protein
MVAPLSVNPHFYFLMAIEALFIRNFFTQGVALGTIGHSLQVFVHLGEVTRRYLRGQRHRQQEEYIY